MMLGRHLRIVAPLFLKSLYLRSGCMIAQGVGCNAVTVACADNILFPTIVFGQAGFHMAFSPFVAQPDVNEIQLDRMWCH